MYSALFKYLLKHAHTNDDLSERFLEDYDLISIEQITTTGSQLPYIYWNRAVIIRKDIWIL